MKEARPIVIAAAVTVLVMLFVVMILLISWPSISGERVQRGIFGYRGRFQEETGDLAGQIIIQPSLA